MEYLCPFCNPCDSFKTVSIYSDNVPTSLNYIQELFKGNVHLNTNPSSVHVFLIGAFNPHSDLKTERRRNRKAVLRDIHMYSPQDKLDDIYNLADIHITSMLLPKSTNITFSNDFDKLYGKWENVRVHACSSEKGINSFPYFRSVIKRKSFKFRNIKRAD